MGSQYSVEDEASDTEFLVMGGRSFDALIGFLGSLNSQSDRIRILHDCEYQGDDDCVPERVTFDGTIVADDAGRVIAALSYADAEFRLGAFEAREWIEMFRRLRAWANTHPDHLFRPRFCE